MLLKIAQLGQPVLRQAAEPVADSEIAGTAFQGLIDDMIETLAAARGVGLAAPQVFVSKRLFLAKVLPPETEDSPGDLEVFINPRLTMLSEAKESAWEGCLSFLELLVNVPRFVHLRIDYQNRRGEPHSLELRDFPARVVQHENDHLDGILTIDRAVTARHIIKASEIEAVRMS